MKVAVLTDSTSYIPQDLIEKYHIPIAHLYVTLNDNESYKEFVEISKEQCYDKLKDIKTAPRTSQPAIGTLVDMYEKLKDEGYTDVISIHLSSGISGTVQTAMQVNDMIEGINIHVFDTKIAAFAEGVFVLKAIELIEQGLEPDAILKELESMREETGAYIVVDDLKYLQKSGRISNAQAWIGTLLKMKPLLCFEDGKIVPNEKVRTKKRALKMMVRKAAEEIKDAEDKTLLVIGGDKVDESNEVYESMKKEFPDYDVLFSEFGPVVASHLGPGGIGVGYIGRKIKM
ncbi:fatty acid kinase binding subunit FakB1 [Staphylococcus massiliensis]|uniref:fatty acid kinase binding subunit FakB1 n=1 Tax=Staphylococcus massiliensis TaxID=555791 RepID=UPI001EDCA7B4|nr:fatty acid kinase binding subunit FakB1 [Staphylococcus massiliensis]MCG3400070.1 fatty acid kinase binding subunit FakB1 [Staphylococcus massiliensis]MCG3401793.1 fatty acid kinase binding subunit FakB1 [Staphylococcus massiliensis]